MIKMMQTAPFTIDAPAIAAGMIELFTQDEKDILRFGMLPAEKMESLRRAIERRFSQTEHAIVRNNDEYICVHETPTRRNIITFSMKKLVAEAMHEITLEIYKIGDLVV